MTMNPSGGMPPTTSKLIWVRDRSIQAWAFLRQVPPFLYKHWRWSLAALAVLLAGISWWLFGDVLLLISIVVIVLIAWNIKWKDLRGWQRALYIAGLVFVPLALPVMIHIYMWVGYKAYGLNRTLYPRPLQVIWNVDPHFVEDDPNRQDDDDWGKKIKRLNPHEKENEAVQEILLSCSNLFGLDVDHIGSPHSSDWDIDEGLPLITFESRDKWQPPAPKKEEGEKKQEKKAAKAEQAQKQPVAEDQSAEVTEPPTVPPASSPTIMTKVILVHLILPLKEGERVAENEDGIFQGGKVRYSMVTMPLEAPYELSMELLMRGFAKAKGVPLTDAMLSQMLSKRSTK